MHKPAVNGGLVVKAQAADQRQVFRMRHESIDEVEQVPDIGPVEQAVTVQVEQVVNRGRIEEISGVVADPSEIRSVNKCVR